MKGYGTYFVTVVQLLSWNSFITRGFAPRPPKRRMITHVASTAEPNDDGYVSIFRGRAMLRPCLQRVMSSSASPSYDTLSLFGWTIGGRVALQYDISPTADELPYNEFVSLGCLGICEHGIGQVGTALYVNETGAVELCDTVWNLNAKLARIDLGEKGSTVSIEEDVHNRVFRVDGWSTLRGESSEDRNVRLNLFWTPTITGIWARLLPWWPFRKTGGLPAHRLRVSGNAKLQFGGSMASVQSNTTDLVPLGVDILLQNALIEISPRII